MKTEMVPSFTKEIVKHIFYSAQNKVISNFHQRETKMMSENSFTVENIARSKTSAQQTNKAGQSNVGK